MPLRTEPQFVPTSNYHWLKNCTVFIRECANTRQKISAPWIFPDYAGCKITTEWGAQQRGASLSGEHNDYGSHPQNGVSCSSLPFSGSARQTSPRRYALYGTFSLRPPGHLKSSCSGNGCLQAHALTNPHHRPPTPQAQNAGGCYVPDDLEEWEHSHRA